MAMRSSYSGSSASESGSSCGRVRTVKLSRRPPPAKLGFSLRGGSEHGTGFFVTSVEPGSEANNQGLLVGDQIIRVNGFPVDDATHKEVLQLIQGQNIVTLKVKSVGMIPVKENPNDELTWRIVEPESLSNSDIIRTDICEDSNGPRLPNDVRMTLKVPPKAKLGCGICKGPEWKPGVFVQFTKENSIARQAGLRPGDQIIQCNNFTFTPDTPFNEAVSILRCSGVLELIVRKGAGLDLFPGESSGYNSSASSVAGDNPWPHRLSVVTEESSNHGRGERSMNGNDRRDQNGIHNTRTEYTNGCTVIHVGGADSDSKNKLAEICMVSQQLETKTTTVLVEVHHSEEDDVSHTQSDSSTDRLTNCSSVSSFTSSASSLSSAISQELERRSKRPPQDPSIKAQQQADKLIKSGLAKEKVHQHEQLMEEFKKAHRKMFSSSDLEKATKQSEPEERQEAKEIENQKKVQNGDLRPPTEKKEKGKDVFDGEKLRTKRQIAPPPPPPPPPVEQILSPKPLTSGKKYPAPPPPSPPYCPTPDYDTTSLASEATEEAKPVQNNVLRNGFVKQKGDLVEMQSLESFKLTNPLVLKPKPPNTYFSRSKESSNSDTSNGTASTLPIKDSKPMVTIREYPGNKDRRSPTKFEFLQNGISQISDINCNNQHITSRLQNELTQTLSRANLIAKTESTSNKVPETAQNGHPKGTVVTISMNQQKKPPAPQQPPFYLFPNGNNANGTDKKVSKPLASIIQKAATEKPKPQIIENAMKNSVTFHFGNTEKETKNGTAVHPNGILKNGNSNISHVQIHPQPGGERIGQQKSIKFGGM